MESIDFDEASKAWMANKIRKGESYVYKCSKCKRPASNVEDLSTELFCWQHKKLHIKKTRKKVTS